MLSIFNLSGGTAQSGRSHCSIQAEPLLNFAGRGDFAQRCTQKDVVEGAFVGAVGGAISSLSLCAGPLGREEVLKWSIVGRGAGTVLSGIFTDSVC